MEKNKASNNFQKLDELKQKLDSFRPLSAEIIANLHEDLVLRGLIIPMPLKVIL